MNVIVWLEPYNDAWLYFKNGSYLIESRNESETVGPE